MAAINKIDDFINGLCDLSGIEPQQDQDDSLFMPELLQMNITAKCINLFDDD